MVDRARELRSVHHQLEEPVFASSRRADRFRREERLRRDRLRHPQSPDLPVVNESSEAVMRLLSTPPQRREIDMAGAQPFRYSYSQYDSRMGDINISYQDEGDDFPSFGVDLPPERADTPRPAFGTLQDVYGSITIRDVKKLTTPDDSDPDTDGEDSDDEQTCTI